MKVPYFLKVLKRKVVGLYIRHKYFLWRDVKIQNKRYREHPDRAAEGYYTAPATKRSGKKRAVCIYNECNLKIGGLVDRLRAIVSIYKICKEKDIELKVLFTHPFNLNRYLQPAKVDWKITPQELNYNTNETDLCYIYTATGSDYEIKKQEKWFRRELGREFHEFHIRTNAMFSYKHNFSELFCEIFEPTPLLKSLIDKQKEILGEEYISTSFRFLNLLGDFNEPCAKTPLTIEESSKLISANIAQIEKLHTEFPDKKILVNSDSITFLQAADNLPYTYVIPGEISHVDNSTTEAGNAHDKTLTDFFMIANAQSIYLFITGDMYNSGFPYAASMLYNRPFHIVRH